MRWNTGTMCCNARSQASPSEPPVWKRNTVQVAVLPWSTTGATTTAEALRQPAKVRRSAIISRSISSRVMGSLSISANSRADLPSPLSLVVLMLVQEAGDLSPQRGNVGQVAHGTGTIEELPLQLFRYGVPLHYDRRSQASKNVLLGGGEGGRPLAVLVRSVQCFLEIVRQPFLVVGKRCEAALSLAEFSCLRAIVLGRKHAAISLFAESCFDSRSAPALAPYDGAQRIWGR